VQCSTLSFDRMQPRRQRGYTFFSWDDRLTLCSPPPRGSVSSPLFLGSLLLYLEIPLPPFASLLVLRACSRTGNQMVPSLRFGLLLLYWNVKLSLRGSVRINPPPFFIPDGFDLRLCRHWFSPFPPRETLLLPSGLEPRTNVPLFDLGSFFAALSFLVTLGFRPVGDCI